MTVRLVSMLSILVLLAACGGGSSSGGGGGDHSTGQETASETEGFDEFDTSDPSVDHGSGSARELLGVHGPETPWAQMSHDDQEMYMVAYVLPIAAESFRGYDASRYTQFECNNCHGDDGQERRYEMPSRYLPALPVPGSPQWNQMRERNPRAFEFMTNDVTPTVRTQLGLPEYDPATGQGFGCFSCHPHAS